MISSSTTLKTPPSMSEAIKVLHQTKEIFDNMPLYLFTTKLFEKPIKSEVFISMCLEKIVHYFHCFFKSSDVWPSFMSIVLAFKIYFYLMLHLWTIWCVVSDYIEHHISYRILFHSSHNKIVAGMNISSGMDVNEDECKNTLVTDA